MERAAYKLFRVKRNAPGELFPLFVFANEAMPMHAWLTAKEGPRTENGKVKSRLGPLAFRPGFHLSVLPLATHIGKAVDGEITYMHPDTVWCRCLYSADQDYQKEADQMGMRNGVLIHQKACLPYIPEDGFYHYKTSPRMFGDWIIAGRMKIEEILTDQKVQEILEPKGLEAQPRMEPLDLAAYGFSIEKGTQHE